MRKGQAALEFLTTYGWAFLVVLVMIGALAYFGVINPSRLLPDKCIFGTGIGCQDFVAYSGTNEGFRAELVNGFGYTITIVDVDIDCSGVASGVCPDDCDAVGDGNHACNLGYEKGTTNAKSSWKSDEERELIISTVGMSEGDRPKVEVVITYMKSGSTYQKQITGDISAKPTPRT